MTKREKEAAEAILAIQKGYAEGEYKNDKAQVAYYKGMKDMYDLLLAYEGNCSKRK